MGRVGLLGRIMLVLLGAVSLLVVATFGIDRWQRNHERSPYPSRFPRVDQAAHIVSLLRDADPAQRPAILKAVSGEALRAEIVDAPPDEADLIREPRLEARLLRIAGEPAGRIRAFTDAAMLHRGVDPAEPAAERHGPVGRLAAATYRLPDGRVLVVTVIEGHRSHMPWLLGQPLSLWVAILGVVVAGLVTIGARHELAPLQRLTEAVARFDGRAPSPSPATHQGAPEIRRLAQAIQAMQERIAGLMGERSLLIGAISHDLKTYLTRMRLRAEGVAEAGRRERLVEDLDAMTALIETSLSFARGTAAEIGRSPVDLADIVAVEVAEHAAQGAPISLSGEEVRNATVAGDAVALRRVVANLVGNAVKYGRSSVAVAVRRTGAACEIVVEDDGPGIPEAERAAVFSPYYRVERSRSRQTGGSGLGLAIARQIAEAHGGSIVAEAAASGGARIVVTLPALA